MRKFIGKALILTVVIFFIAIQFNKDERAEKAELHKIVKFVECVDGDTAKFSIDGKNEIVRFLAIDTPETKKPNTPVQPFGKEASEYTCNVLKSAKTIRLEFEEKNKKDKYNRTLSWIFVEDELLQNKLVKKGLAKVAYLYDEYKYTSILKDGQKQAKKDKLGIWN